MFGFKKWHLKAWRMSEIATRQEGRERAWDSVEEERWIFPGIFIKLTVWPGYGRIPSVNSLRDHRKKLIKAHED